MRTVPIGRDMFIFNTTPRRDTLVIIKNILSEEFLNIQYIELLLLCHWFSLVLLCYRSRAHAHRHTDTHTHMLRHWFGCFRARGGKGEHSWRSLDNWSLESSRCRAHFLLSSLTRGLSQPLTRALFISRLLGMFPLNVHSRDCSEVKEERGRTLVYRGCGCDALGIRSRLAAEIPYRQGKKTAEKTAKMFIVFNSAASQLSCRRLHFYCI